MTETEALTVRQLRRNALAQDALLFCGAFTVGALLYFVGRAITLGVGDDSGDFWTISLSDDLILSGLLAGELFLVWNNGLRQGVRGHSIGKHREGLAVVDRTTHAPTGAAKGLLRGLVMAVLLDLAVAAIPIGLPTAFRRLTPDSWHIGGAAYLALLAIVVPLLASTHLSFADRVVGTEVVTAEGPDARTSHRRSQALLALDVAGVVGVLAVAVSYIVYFSPLLRFPHLF